MPPKTSQPRKRTVQRGSSSSSAPFDAQRFQSLSRETSFDNVFSKKQVIVERQVKFARMEIDFKDWLLERGWNSLYDFSPIAYGSLVREFYNNIHDIGNESFKTFVRGFLIEVDPNFLSQFLQIDRSLDAVYPEPEPDSEDMEDKVDDTDWGAVVTTLTGGRRRDWVGGVLKQKYLTPSFRMLNLFVCFNLEPKGRTSEVIMETGYLLYVIGTGKPIDVPLVIFKHMLDALQSASTTSLPFGVLISRILISHGVAISPHDDVAKGRGPITYRTITQSTSHVADSDEEDPAPCAAARDFEAPSETQMPSYFQDFENRLFDQSTQIELLEHRMNSQFQDVFAQMEQLNLGSHRIEGKLDTLLRRFPPPQ